MPKPNIKGREVGSMKAFKKSLKRRSNQFLKRIPEEGLSVRFLTEPEKWVEYKEHYDEDHEPRYFPCVEGVCEGCQTLENKPQSRYLASVLDIDEKQAVPLVVPVSLARELEARYDKYQTIMDRDYELQKDGQGFDTRYSAFNEGPTKRNISKYEPFDLLAVLSSQLEEDDEDVDDDDDIDDDDTDSVPSGRRGATTARKRRVRDDDDDDDDDDVARPRKRAMAKKRVAKPAAKKTVAKKKKRGLSK